jgi:hypothetical protein
MCWEAGRLRRQVQYEKEPQCDVRPLVHAGLAEEATRNLHVDRSEGAFDLHDDTDRPDDHHDVNSSAAVVTNLSQRVAARLARVEPLGEVIGKRLLEGRGSGTPTE